MKINNDPAYIHKIQQEFYSQKLKQPKYQTVKLPCGHRVQLIRPQDQYIKCPGCNRQFLYVHSMNSRRLYEK